MRLRFIGADGSMNLKHGNVYNVKVSSRSGYIYVKIGCSWRCPYSSPKTFADNWESV